METNEKSDEELKIDLILCSDRSMIIDDPFASLDFELPIYSKDHQIVSRIKSIAASLKKESSGLDEL